MLKVCNEMRCKSNGQEYFMLEIELKLIIREEMFIESIDKDPNFR